jgi:hypothetical protein
VNLSVAITIIKFCLTLRAFTQFIEAKVRERYDAADLLAIDKACGLYVESTDVREKSNEAEDIRNAFRDKDSKHPTSGSDSN